MRRQCLWSSDVEVELRDRIGLAPSGSCSITPQPSILASRSWVSQVGMIVAVKSNVGDREPTIDLLRTWVLVCTDLVWEG